MRIGDTRVVFYIKKLEPLKCSVGHCANAKMDKLDPFNYVCFLM